MCHDDRSVCPWRRHPHRRSLKAARIRAQNARLNVLSNTLSFTSATLEGMSITRTANGQTLSITSSGQVTAGYTDIKTSVFNDLSTIGSFQNPLDLATLTFGGTVQDLVLTNVTLNIDDSMSSSSLNIPDMQLVYQ
ncbi:MAG: hypothetical protein IRZ10_10810 [Thermoflavifilum sp.]|nr:hypothetical protein [Thermoflavifilum sp.]MCL6514897.1 hypothetical protein [Alicyclobacillus sp.]